MGGLDNLELRLVGGHPALDLVNTVEPRVVGGVPEKDHLRTPEELVGWCLRTGVLRGEHEAAWVTGAWFGPQVLTAVLTIREALYTVLLARLQEHRDDDLTRDPRAGDDQAADGWTGDDRTRDGRAGDDRAGDDRAEDRREAAHEKAVQEAKRIHQESAVAAALEELLLRHSAAIARGRLSLAIGGPAPGSLAVGTVPQFAVQDRLAHAAVEVFTTVGTEDFRICPLDEGGCGWVFLDRSRNHSRRWCAMADCGSRVKARKLTRRRRSTAGSAAGS